MRSAANGIVMEGPEAFPRLVPGTTQTARVRIRLAKAPTDPVVVPLRIQEAPEGWPTRIRPPQARLDANHPWADVEVEVSVPEGAPEGDAQVWVRADHDGAGAGIGLPVRVVAHRRRVGLAAAAAGTALAVGAAAAALAWVRKPARRLRWRW